MCVCVCVCVCVFSSLSKGSDMVIVVFEKIIDYCMEGDLKER